MLHTDKATALLQTTRNRYTRCQYPEERTLLLTALAIEMHQRTTEYLLTIAEAERVCDLLCTYLQRELTETETAEYLMLASLIFMREEMYRDHLQQPPQ